MQFLSTPSHGYLIVPMGELRASGFIPSMYSYFDLKLKQAYLEEDCDASGYIDAIGSPQIALSVLYGELPHHRLNIFSGDSV